MDVRVLCSMDVPKYVLMSSFMDVRIRMYFFIGHFAMKSVPEPLATIGHFQDRTGGTPKCENKIFIFKLKTL